MKTKSLMMMAALCGQAMVAARGAEVAVKSDSAAEPAATPSATIAAPSTHPPTPNAKPVSPRLPAALAAEKETEKAIRAHIKPTEALMESPPPAARAETKPARPAENYVWVPGHWSPQDGEWKWTAGQWSQPATPVSVWIEAKYDPKTKRWSPGYWQPDRPDSYENETPAKEPAAPAK